MERQRVREHIDQRHYIRSSMEVEHSGAETYGCRSHNAGQIEHSGIR